VQFRSDNKKIKNIFHSVPKFSFCMFFVMIMAFSVLSRVKRTFSTLYTRLVRIDKIILCLCGRVVSSWNISFIPDIKNYKKNSTFYFTYFVIVYDYLSNLIINNEYSLITFSFWYKKKMQTLSISFFILLSDAKISRQVI